MTASPWSFRLATVAGIPIRVHFTFVLLATWIAVAGQDQMGPLWLGFIAAMTLCVLLHEFGHAIVARYMGIRTRDITLNALGGVATLESRPNPKQELAIAVAGPMVNIVIGMALFIGLLTSGPKFEMVRTLTPQSFVTGLMGANFLLAIFNLLPTFPMDGGRMLRAGLSLGMDEMIATRIVAGLGQVFAILLGAVAIVTGQILVVFIAVFVFLGASHELAAAVSRSLLIGRTVADAMQRNFMTLLHGDTLDHASKVLLNGSQTVFPVMAGEEVVGVLTRDDITNGMSDAGPDAYIAQSMNRTFETAGPNDPLEPLAERMGKTRQAVLVLNGQELLGVVTMENLSEFIMVAHAKDRNRRLTSRE